MKVSKAIKNVNKANHFKFLAPLLLALSCGVAQAVEQPLDRIAVIVDDGIIMHSQYVQRLAEVKHNLGKSGVEIPPDQVLSQQVLDRMVLEQIQLQLGDNLGIRISDEELNQALENIAARNQMSMAQFAQAVVEDGLSMQQLRDQVRQEMIISRVRQYQVGERAQVSEQEVKAFLASTLGQLQLSEDYHLANIVIALPDSPDAEDIAQARQRVNEIQQQLANGVSFAQLAISYSASENAFEGGDMGWRKAAQLPPPFDTLVSELKVGEVSEPVRTSGGIILLKLLDKEGVDQVHTEEVHVRHILIKTSAVRDSEQAQQLAEQLHQRLLAGEDFAELARQYSQDPGSARDGGDLGWMEPDDLVPEFRQMMAASKIGQLSAPFATQFGWHVLQVLDRRVTDSSEQAREQQALQLLHNRKYEEELQIWLREIRDEAYVEIKQL